MNKPFNLIEKVKELQYAKTACILGEINQNKGVGAGRFQSPDTPLMWCVAEISEAWDAYRKNKFLKEDELNKLKELYTAFTEQPTEENRVAFVSYFGSVKSSFQIEILDAVIMIFDTVTVWSGLEEETLDFLTKSKVLYNTVRNDYKYKYDKDGNPVIE
jgi:hypothetical protein